MAFWDFEDARYKGARALTIASMAGVVVTAVGLTLLFWNYDEKPADTIVAKPTPKPTPTPPPSPEQIRQSQIQELRATLADPIARQDWQQIKSISKSILELDPADLEGWRHLGWSQEQRGELESALASYSQVISLPGSIPYDRFLRARVLRKKGDLAGAIMDLEEASKEDPGSVGMSNLLMIFKLQAGRDAEVRAMVASYAAVGIKNQADLWLLGAAALALKDGNIPRADASLGGFQAVVDPQLFSELLGDPFFDPYRNTVELIPYFSLAKK
ncbi:MAG: tetratricopeptide repeat protein [Terrimicrobiaceae bacterium]